MNGWGVRGTVLVDDSAAGVDAAYRGEVNWMQGYRINSDARLVLLGVQRILARGLAKEAELRRAALVLGCQLGSMGSYEAFDDSLAQGQTSPLSFSHALPSTALASASVRHGLRGPTLTLVGGGEVGVRAFRQGVRMLASGRAELAVAGCWEAPSETASRVGLPSRPRLLLAVLEQAAQGTMGLPCPEGREGTPGQGCVAALADFVGRLTPAPSPQPA